MIEYKTGDILAEDVEALVNSVNCVGVMGAVLHCNSRRHFQKISMHMLPPADARKSNLDACLYLRLAI